MHTRRTIFYILTIAILPFCPARGYEGREPDAPWRADAEKRIDKVRKGALTIHVVGADGQPIPGATVGVQMQRHAFGFGSAVTARMLNTESGDGRRYRDIVERNYNKIVFENDLKWDPWNVAKSNTNRTYRREWIERALAWLKKRDIEVRGHYITWAPLKPHQLRKYENRPEVLRADLWAHMEEKVPQLGQRVQEWDAVNHIVGWGKTLSTLLGGDRIYVDIIKRSRQLAPHAELWINEGQILPGGMRRDAYERMVKTLIAGGGAPDGIGFMGHFSRRNMTPPEEIYRVLERFAKVTPKLQITEFDVNVGRDEKLQADYLRDVMITAFSHPNLEAIVMWGFWEGRHWKPDAALYRRDWSIKPAGRAWKELVYKKWWTTERGQTAADGSLKIQGFLGDYEIVARKQDRAATVKATLAKKGARVKVVLK